MLSDFTSLNVWSQLNLVFTWTLVLYVTKATNMKIDDLHDLPWPRSTSVWFGEWDLDISCIVFCHITITQIWFDKKKYLGKKVYIQYQRMRSRYLYNLQIYNVLILVSLSIEEDLVCSQARWWWFFLAEATLILSQSVSQTDRLTLTVMSVRCDVDQSQAWLCLGVGQWAMIDGESLPAWQQWVELSERAVEYFIKLLTRNFVRNHYFFYLRANGERSSKYWPRLRVTRTRI